MILLSRNDFEPMSALPTVLSVNYFARASGSEVLQSVCLYHATMYTIIGAHNIVA